MPNSGEDVIAAVQRELIPLIWSVSKKHAHTAIDVEVKGHGHFTTNISNEIERDLRDHLFSLVEGAGFVTPLVDNPGEKWTWIINPIDGVNNFLNDLPYAITIALRREEDEKLVLGVVANPRDNTVFYAVVGRGAYAIRGDYSPVRLQVHKFPRNEGISIFGMSYDRDKATKTVQVARRLYDVSSDIKRIGPSSLDICRIAQNKAKYYAEFDLEKWDVSAGLIILQEAGGGYVKANDLYLFYGAQLGPVPEKMMEQYEATGELR